MRARRIAARLTALLAVASVVGCSSSASDRSGQASAPICGADATDTVTAGVLACPQGFADCDGDPSNGCETSVEADLAHCGACGHACSAAHGTPSCAGGVCAIVCDPGFADCDDDVANGCETDTATDPESCGACGAACPQAHAIPSCAAGVCSLACDPGFGDCDGVLANGCETDTATSLVDCGTCGTVCVAFNGTASCTAGFCALACAPGFGDCDRNPKNGCETGTATDVANCGACGHACGSANGSASCAGGACVLHCDPGFADCDGNAANGCESELASDVASCGACGRVCGSENAISSCTAGACAIACSAGYGDCDGAAADGCEASLTTDPANCGACGHACVAPTPTCVGGGCQ
jgi:hypothetical protein